MAQSLQIPVWISDDLTRFASGEWPWDRWGRWLAIHARRVAHELDSEWFARIKSNPQSEVPALLSAANIQVEPFVDSFALKCDPIDNDPNYADIISEVERVAEAEAGMPDFQLGTCHVIWRIKKRILKERFNIEWKSPAELNPSVTFD